MNIIAQHERYQYVSDGKRRFFRYAYGFQGWREIPRRCREHKRRAFLSLLEVIAS